MTPIRSYRSLSPRRSISSFRLDTVGVSNSGPSANRMKITPLITLRQRIPCNGVSNQLRSVNQYIHGRMKAPQFTKNER